MLNKFFLLTIPELEETTDPLIDMFNSIFSAAVPLIGAVGAVVCVILGVKYAKADDSQERDQAKKALINSVLGFVSAFVLVVVMNTAMPVLTNWVSGNFTDPAMIAEQEAAGQQAASNKAQSGAAASQANPKETQTEIIDKVLEEVVKTAKASKRKESSVYQADVINVKEAVLETWGTLDSTGKKHVAEIENAAILSIEMSLDAGLKDSQIDAVIEAAVKKASLRYVNIAKNPQLQRSSPSIAEIVEAAIVAEIGQAAKSSSSTGGGFRRG